MMCFNLRPGDHIRVGGAVVAFIHKQDGQAWFDIGFEEDWPAKARRSGLLPGWRANIPGSDSSFTLDRRSGRGARIVLDTKPDVRVTRIQISSLSSGIAIMGLHSSKTHA